MTSKISLSGLFKRLPRRIRRLITPLSGLLFYYDSGLKREGWFESLTQLMPVDARGEPIPWMNYPVINFLDERLSSEHIVFEYGSGNSTKWFSGRVKAVTSIEHDSEWGEIVKPGLPSNSTLELHTTKEEYINSLSEFSIRESPPDVVIVDGKWREECIREAIGVLKESSVVVVDDCDREEYTAGIKALEDSGFDRIVISGMKPMDFGESSTAIFYRDSNCFEI